MSKSWHTEWIHKGSINNVVNVVKWLKSRISLIKNIKLFFKMEKKNGLTLVFTICVELKSNESIIMILPFYLCALRFVDRVHCDFNLNQINIMYSKLLSSIGWRVLLIHIFYLYVLVFLTTSKIAPFLPNFAATFTEAHP